MAALATTAEFEARLGRALTAGAETDRVEALLDDVSAVVRAYTGQQITSSSTTDRIQVRNGTVRLPQRPVTAVAGVDNVDGDPIGYSWDAGDAIYLDGFNPSRSFEVAPFINRTPWVDVTYTHGYATVPADIVAVVCQMVGRAFGRTAETAGVTQESIAGYSYSVGAAAAAGPMGMLADERRILDKYRRPIGSIRVSP